MPAEITENMFVNVLMVISKWAQNFIVVYKPVAKQWIFVQRPLLCTARTIHARNNRKPGSCYLFQSNVSVNTFPSNWHQLNNRRTVFSVWSVPCCCRQGSLKQWSRCWLELSAVQLSVVIQPVEIRQRDLCEMTDSLGPRWLSYQLIGSSAWADITRRPQ